MILDHTSAALLTTLQSGTALTALLPGTTSIYDMQAQDNDTLPYIIFTHMGGGPDNIAPVNLENNLWQVRAFGTSAKNATEIFEQADLLLNRKAISISGYNTFWCNRETNIKLVENLPNNVKIYTAGGIYRIRTSE